MQSRLDKTVDLIYISFKIIRLFKGVNNEYQGIIVLWLMGKSWIELKFLGDGKALYHNA